MGKLRIWVLLQALLLLLWGCTSQEESRMDDALAFRSALVGAGGCSFLGEITADYGDEAYTFTAACTTDDTGALSFSLTVPETIAGISGTVQSRGGKLTFDSTALAFGLLADGKVSPATAPYVVAESWRTGYITSVGQEENGLRLTVDTSLEENPLTVDTWLDREKGIPIFAEVCYNGQRILTISISEFQYNT